MFRFTAAAADDDPHPALCFGPRPVDGEPSAPPVLLLHGQPGRASVWRAVGDELARRDLRAIAIDRPGYGQSDRSAVGFAGNADAVIELLDEHGVDQVTVVAHSWAGAAALALAVRAPERIQGLVLLAPVGGVGSVTLLDHLLAMPVVGWGVLRAGLRLGALLLDRDRTRRFLPAGFADLEPVAAKQMAGAALLPHARHSAAVEQRALVHELPSVRAGVGSIAVPTIVMAGSHDLIVPTSASEELAAAIPGAVFELVDAGHLLPSEVPGLVADAVEQVQAATLASCVS